MFLQVSNRKSGGTENKAVFEFEKYRKERDKKFESDFDREFKRLLDNKQLKNDNKK